MGKVEKTGIDRQFQQQVRDMLQPGTSALFLILEKVTPDKAIAALSPLRRHRAQVLALRAGRGRAAGGAARVGHAGVRQVRQLSDGSAAMGLFDPTSSSTWTGARSDRLRGGRVSRRAAEGRGPAAARRPRRPGHHPDPRPGPGARRIWTVRSAGSSSPTSTVTSGSTWRVFEGASSGLLDEDDIAAAGAALKPGSCRRHPHLRERVGRPVRGGPAAGRRPTRGQRTAAGSGRPGGAGRRGSQRSDPTDRSEERERCQDCYEVWRARR